MRGNVLICLNKLLCLLLCVMILGLLGLDVYAQPEGGSSVTVEFQHEGFSIADAEFKLYRVADLSGNRELTYLPDFADLRLDAEALIHAAYDLHTRVQDRGVQPERVFSTNKEGVGAAAKLAPGAFLMVCTPTSVNGYVYYVDKQVILLEDEPVTLHPKSTRLPEQTELISITAVKQWEDRGYENERPSAIAVRLLRDGKQVSSAVLSDANGWSYTWNDLLPNARWAVEEDVPEGYKVTIQESEHTFTLTNHRKDIPQTGHIWWPVIAVLCAGLVLIIVGLTLRRSGSHET